MPCGRTSVVPSGLLADARDAGFDSRHIEERNTKVSVKIHITVALVAATCAVLLLSLLVISQDAQGATESRSPERPVLTLDVRPDISAMGPAVAM